MADKIISELNYIEGAWAAKSMINNIERTEYKTVEQAIKVKQELIKHFEDDFGFNRNMDNIDGNYAYNYGILDALIEEHSKNNSDENS